MLNSHSEITCLSHLFLRKNNFKVKYIYMLKKRKEVEKMGPATGDNFNRAFLPAFMNFDLMFGDDATYVDELLKGKDDISRSEIIRNMNQFKSKEELERYVTQMEEKDTIR